MRVHWTDNAAEHLLGIYEYIAQNSPPYAKRTVDRLTRRSEQIAVFPMSGRKVAEYEADDIREMIEKPYRIIYRIKPDQIDILAVVHGAQLLPPKI
ncbi:MAG: hypothetical protein DDT29_02439 [Dehalococcoidia bacterium]|nr:hypothetical protein [Bacillota bacterium]